MANDIKLGDSHPLADNLYPIKVGGEVSSLEISKTGNGAKINGDLEIMGIVDKLDVNKIVKTSDVNNSGDLLIKATAGDILLSPHGQDIHIKTGDLNTITLHNGASAVTSITMRSILDTGDYSQLSTTTKGATTFTTVDDDGTDADLTFNIDGYIDLNSASGDSISLDSGGDIILDAAGGDVNVLQADLTMPDDKKVIFGDAGEHIVGDGADLDIVSSGRITTTATGAYKVDSGAGIILDSATGAYQMHGAGTASQFSVDDSAYAGMILGYTTVGIDVADDSYTLTTSMVVTDSAHNVSFIAPPSGVVEIFVSVYGDFNRRVVYLGLSDNATYNTLDVTHEHSVSLPGAANDVEIRHSWVITGLTAGDTYKYWLGAKSSHVLSSTLRWGGDATGEYAPFIMKATALPTAVADFAVYG
tara:strand:+ start:317 stop:1567 length:1251 start_codon:yes stop_codon:yes gene_type:complete